MLLCCVLWLFLPQPTEYVAITPSPSSPTTSSSASSAAATATSYERVLISAAPALRILLAAIVQCATLMSVRLSGNGIDRFGAELIGATLLHPVI